MLHLGHVFRPDDEHSQYLVQNNSTRDQEKQRDYRAFSLVKSTDLVTDSTGARGRTKDNTGILTAGQTDGSPQRIQTGTGVLSDAKSLDEVGDQECLVGPICPVVILTRPDIRTEKLKCWIPSRQQRGKST